MVRSWKLKGCITRTPTVMPMTPWYKIFVPMKHQLIITLFIVSSLFWTTTVYICNWISSYLYFLLLLPTSTSYFYFLLLLLFLLLAPTFSFPMFLLTDFPLATFPPSTCPPSSFPPSIFPPCTFSTFSPCTFPPFEFIEKRWGDKECIHLFESLFLALY